MMNMRMYTDMNVELHIERLVKERSEMHRQIKKFVRGGDCL